MTEQAPVVYITQELGHIDFAPAERYGDIVFCSINDLPTVKSSLRAKSALADMKKLMSNYRPGIDYILPSGSPLNIAAMMILAGRRGDTHNILKWESRMGTYNKVVLEVPSGI